LIKLAEDVLPALLVKMYLLRETQEYRFQRSLGNWISVFQCSFWTLVLPPVVGDLLVIQVKRVNFNVIHSNITLLSVIIILNYY